MSTARLTPCVVPSLEDVLRFNVPVNDPHLVEVRQALCQLKKRRRDVPVNLIDQLQLTVAKTISITTLLVEVEEACLTELDRDVDEVGVFLIIEIPYDVGMVVTLFEEIHLLQCQFKVLWHHLFDGDISVALAACVHNRAAASKTYDAVFKDFKVVQNGRARYVIRTATGSDLVWLQGTVLFNLSPDLFGEPFFIVIVGVRLLLALFPTPLPTMGLLLLRYFNSTIGVRFTGFSSLLAFDRWS